MSAEGFARDQAWSVFEALRPGPGQTVEKVAVVTYSLDLVAVAGLLLSLGTSGEDEFQAGPLEFADAVRALKDRLVIIHQKGRLKTPTRYRDILHILDGTVRSTNPERGASWHPKAILAKYAAPRGGVSWRLWLGSRNLTGSRDREAGLLLVAAARKSSAPSGAGPVLRDLFAEADFSAEDFLSLDQVRWLAPTGVRLRRLHWRSLGQTGPLVTPLPRAKSLLAIAPFVDTEGLNSLPPAAERKLLTTSKDLALLSPGDFKVRVAGAPSFDEPVEPQQPAMGDQPSPFSGAGLHAKLILQRSASINRLWIGSANATRRGLIGPNAELMAEIDVPDGYADALEAYWARGSEPPGIIEDDPQAAATRLAERCLDRALCELHALEFELRLDPDGLALRASASLDGFLSDYRLEVSLTTLDGDRKPWRQGADRVLVAGPELPVRLRTFLVDFHAQDPTTPEVSRTWTQPVDFPQFDPAARDHAALAAYIGPSRFTAWLRAQIEGIETPVTERETWTGLPRERSASVWRDAAVRSSFTLENVMAAWARDPDAFEKRVPEIDGVLSAYIDGLAELDEQGQAEARASLADMLTFWAALRSALELDGPNGKA